VGYRVKSLRGTQFRRWALAVLREYLVKGFVMNDSLLNARMAHFDQSPATMAHFDNHRILTNLTPEPLTCRNTDRSIKGNTTPVVGSRHPARVRLPSPAARRDRTCR
jgi:hypothetical protein